MAYVYPPMFENGRLKSSFDPVQIVQGKIFQLLAVYKGELVHDFNYGSEFRVFSSVNNLQADAARLEIDLIENIPEANFLIDAEIDQDGLIVATINWQLLGNEQSPIVISLDPNG